MTSGRPQADGGFTLIETLVAIVLIGIGVAAVLGALQLGVVSAVDQRTLANVETTLVSFAEEIKAQDYIDCDGEDVVDYGGIDDASGVTVVAEIEYWNGDIDDPGFVSSCPGDGDHGIQKVKLEVSAETGDERQIERDHLTLFKRRDG